VEYWNVTHWSAVTSPSPASNSNGLSSISIVSPTSIWVVGASANVASPTQTLTEHWDGTQWSVVSSPDPGSSVDALSGVIALGINNVWAVGYYVMGNDNGHTLILRWGASRGK
jgi:photosystem II stability/assembly factor-like uncharacterized protein